MIAVSRAARAAARGLSAVGAATAAGPSRAAAAAGPSGAAAGRCPAVPRPRRCPAAALPGAALPGAALPGAALPDAAGRALARPGPSRTAAICSRASTCGRCLPVLGVPSVRPGSAGAQPRLWANAVNARAAAA